IAALNHVEERGGDRKAARFDVLRDVPAVFVEEDGPSEHQLEFEIRMVVQLPDQELAAAVVRAAGDRKTDPAPPAAGDLPARGRKKRRHTRAGSWFTTTVFNSV